MAALTRWGLLAYSLIASIASAAHAGSRSASFNLSDAAFDGGVRPAASVSFKITNPALGSGLESTVFASASFHIDSGFAASYLPPAEIAGIRWSDRTTLEWNADRSIGSYALYRNRLSTLAAANGGDCLVSDLTSETSTDSELPGAGNGYFYLVTARNRLGEESTRGYGSDGGERLGGAACP